MRSVLCYGDSNTWGAATVPRPDDRYAPAERWPGVLRSELGPDWMVIEEGLNGRTTATDDPIEYAPDKNGRRILPVVLHTHKPLDVVVVMLGTNDFKARFAKTSWAIAEGAGVLIDIVRSEPVGRGGRKASAILVSPPVILDDLPNHAEMFAGGQQKSRDLARHYRTVAEARGVGFFDAQSVAECSRADGFHLDPAAHRSIGVALAPIVRAASAE
jgi:lysophospholipase L1-like esterase